MACGWLGCEENAKELRVRYEGGYTRLGMGTPIEDPDGEDTMWVCPRCGGECTHIPLDEIIHHDGHTCECVGNAIDDESPPREKP